MSTEKMDHEAAEDKSNEKTGLNQSTDHAHEDGELPGDGELDQSQVKFIKANGDSAAVDTAVEIKTHEPSAFCGMTKEELMKYATDPYWIRVRLILFILFWLCFFAMLAAAIAIIVVAPKCPPRPKMEWWQKSSVYQVYPRSFKDTDNNGIGDIKGIESKLSHFKDLHAGAVWINSIYDSPQVDFGNDITDHKKVSSQYGTLDQLKSLMRALHKKGIKLIMDFIPNHTSDKHAWFQSSRDQTTSNKFKDYYIWHPGKKTSGGTKEPNNWLSVYGGSAWKWDENRKAYYLHQFLPNEPDLNLANKAVQAELKSILSYWLKEVGVDGMFINNVAHLFETPNITQDEPKISGVQGGDYKSLDHIYTTFQPETYEIMTQWRELADQIASETEKPKALIVETSGKPNQTALFYEYKGKKGADLVYGMNLINMKKDCSGTCVQKHVKQWLEHLPEGRTASWVMSNQDNSRVASRVGRDLVNAMSMLLMLLPGTPVTYYGDEIGMEDTKVTWAETQDPVGKSAGQAQYTLYSRDPERTPMQWDDSKFAGFTNATKPWLPVNKNYPKINVQIQRAIGMGLTNVEVYSQIAELRKNESFQWGKIQYAIVDDGVFSFIRVAEGFNRFLVVINFGKSNRRLDFHTALPKSIPCRAKIMANTGNLNHQEFKVGKDVPMDNHVYPPNAGVVFQWKPDAEMPCKKK